MTFFTLLLLFSYFLNYFKNSSTFLYCYTKKKIFNSQNPNNIINDVVITNEAVTDVSSNIISIHPIKLYAIRKSATAIQKIFIGSSAVDVTNNINNNKIIESSNTVILNFPPSHPVNKYYVIKKENIAVHLYRYTNATI